MFYATTMPVDWTWGGNPVQYLSVGDAGYLLPSYSVTFYAHRPCNPVGSDRFFPFGDYQATCQYSHYHPEFGGDCAGAVRHQVLDPGTTDERWVIQWCDVGQIGEGGSTCNWRVVINGSNNTNPNDIRIEWIDVGTHVDEDEDEHTGAFMIWNGVYIPIQCDYTAWADNTSVVIDQP